MLATALGLAGPAGAASKFWTGAVNGNFATGGNWVGGVAQAAGDDLVFQTGITKLFATNNFSPNRAFNSVLFQGSNYFVRGNALLVTNGISSINPAGPNHIDADVDVRASQPWEASGPLAVLDFNGDINLNANTLTVRANTGDFFFSGVISGAGNLVKTNVGTLRMDGAGNNTYGGFTRFDGGVLELDKFALLPSPATFIAIPGDLTVGDGNGLLLTDVLVLMADDQIADTADVTVKNSGHMDLNGHDDRIASLTMQGGTVDTGAGTLALGGNVTGRADPNVAFINGVLSLGGATRTFDIGNGAAGPDMRINATIVPGTTLFQTAGLTKNGAGVLWLAGANTYNGTTMVNDGQLTVSSDKALGATTTPLGGAAGTVLNREAVLFLDGAKVTNEPLTINSTSAFGALDASGASSWTGTILLNVDTTIGSFNTLLLSGAITGTGGFTKLHAGSLTLAGVNVNTYTGVTTVRDGTLLLDKDSGLAIHGAMSGPLVVGEDELPENSDVVRWLQCCQLPDDTDITINASGLVDLNGFGQNVRNLIFNGGDIDTGAGSILPIGDITVNRNTNSQAIISGRMSVLSSPIINVTGHFFSPDLAINAQLFGAGGITKNGVGEVGLSAANSYSGLTTVNDGLLLVDHSLALGSASGGTVVNSGAVLALRFGVDVPAGETLTLAGTGQSGFGALNSSFGSNSWAGNITLSSNATIAVDAGDFLNLSGAIDGGFDLAKTGAGTLLYSGGKANTYKNTFVEAGVLLLRRTVANVSIPGALTIGDGLGGLNADVVRYGLDNQIADGAAITIASSGLLDLNDRNDTVGTIKGVGRIDLGSGVLRAGADDGTDTYDGLILGTGSLFKLGVGAWTLSGNNTYSGPTTVSAGALVVNGSQPHSPVTVNGTATLKGSGVIGDLFVFGNLRPGESPGILTCSNVAFASQGDFFVELNGPAPGAGYDQLNARGTNQMGGSTLHVAVGAGFAPHEGEDFVILNNDGSEGIVGAFAGQPNGSIVTANGLQFRIRYSAIFENDVVLTLTNTAARLVSATVSGGNGDGAIDGNECDFIQIVITNVTGGALTGVTGSLVSKTPGVSVTSGDSAYPTIPAGGRGANTAPFQFSVGPGFVCGTIVTFDLVVTTPSNGTFSIPVSLPSGAAGPAVRFNNSVVTSIPDNNFVDIPILVSGIATPLKRVTVALHITHTADSDLDISLIGPDGTTVNLSSDNGGTASDYGTDCAGDRNRTTFSDSAATSIAGGSAPFAGSFRPEQALAVFNEKSDAAVNGTWRLRVADDTPGAVGSVRCWSLFLSPTACNDGGGACESCPEDRVIRGMLGVGSLTQTKRLIRDGTNSVCGVNKSCPGATGASGDRFYDAYTFENGESNACVTVSLEGECNVFSAAYTNSYDPSDLCLNYLADAGSSTGSGGTRAYSFQAGPGARFVIVAHAVDAGDGCGYTLRVNGGSCRPRLFVSPIAGNKVALDWSTAAVGYGLEQTHALSDPPQPLWVPTPGAPSISNGRFRVIDLIALPPTNTFYHLRKP
ncbi:MAG: autotransporter-associated beta strand repeat-containing protein [Verrucomicrobia bacterium]|nr:autotransporter-associated beta strand repeat-containing protein [Verrucomicrobiota bacterium]